ncbi:hypothetical protein K0M31_003398 [Melipona bicolor]|uniref:Uncharacterized protein n=1 Tax=Melipona bicolor TaxID=60889 RepID=A0AA40FZ50_9HYME|nr:hypothetical protein K0M31_003398 [Melipona bicolor]
MLKRRLPLERTLPFSCIPIPWFAAELESMNKSNTTLSNERHEQFHRADVPRTEEESIYKRGIGIFHHREIGVPGRFARIDLRGWTIPTSLERRGSDSQKKRRRAKQNALRRATAAETRVWGRTRGCQGRNKNGRGQWRKAEAARRGGTGQETRGKLAKPGGRCRSVRGICLH